MFSHHPAPKWTMCCSRGSILPVHYSSSEIEYALLMGRSLFCSANGSSVRYTPSCSQSNSVLRTERVYTCSRFHQFFSWLFDANGELFYAHGYSFPPVLESPFPQTQLLQLAARRRREGPLNQTRPFKRHNPKRIHPLSIQLWRERKEISPIVPTRRDRLCPHRYPR